MFDLYADKTQLTIREKETVTSGSVNACQVRFSFSDDWDGLDKTAAFMAGCAPVYILLDDSGECTVPAEVLTQPGRYLMAGVYGKRGEEMVLPTRWGNLGMVQEGVAVSNPSVPPTLELWEQALDRKGDSLSCDGTNLSLLSGHKPLSTVQMISDHRQLSNLDAENQHPIAAITGLEAELERIPEPVEALTNTELEEMLK